MQMFTSKKTTLKRKLKRGLQDHPDLYTKKSIIEGLGLFSTKKLIQGSLIAPFDGDFFSAENDEDLPEHERGFPIQIDENLVQSCLGLAGMSNHSCNPNAGLRQVNGFYWIVARRDIEKHEEICWDYSMSQWMNNFVFYPFTYCFCRFEACRKHQLGAESLEQKIVQEYLIEGWCTAFIREKFCEVRKII